MDTLGGDGSGDAGPKPRKKVRGCVYMIDREENSRHEIRGGSLCEEKMRECQPLMLPGFVASGK